MSNTTTLSILERNRIARERYQEGLELTSKLAALNTQINEAESTLENHINNIPVFNIEELQNTIIERTEYLDELNNEISKYKCVPSEELVKQLNNTFNNSPVEDTSAPSSDEGRRCELYDVEGTRLSDGMKLYEGDNFPEEEYNEQHSSLLLTHPPSSQPPTSVGADGAEEGALGEQLLTKFRELVEKFQTKIDGKLGSYAQKKILEYLQVNSVWAVDRQSEIVDYLNNTGKIYPTYLKEIKNLISELDSENMPF
jgi:hypothetical protein